MKRFISTTLLQLSVPLGVTSPPSYFECWSQVTPQLIQQETAEGAVTLGLVATLLNIDPNIRSIGFMFSEVSFSEGAPTGKTPSFNVGHDTAPPLPSVSSSTYRDTDLYASSLTTIGGITYPQWTQMSTDKKTVDLEQDDSRGGLWHHISLQVIGNLPNSVLIEFQVTKE